MVWPTQVPGRRLPRSVPRGTRRVWFRQMSLFGLSRASRALSLPGRPCLQPVLSLLGLALHRPARPCTVRRRRVLLPRDPIPVCGRPPSRRRPPAPREFQSSGISSSDRRLDQRRLAGPGGRRGARGVFRKAPFPVDLRVSLLSFFRDGKARATVALPTVPPGAVRRPWASDLPEKLSDQLGTDAGVVLRVPHTPCDRRLDLPAESAVDRIGAAGREVLRSVRPPGGAPGEPAKFSVSPEVSLASSGSGISRSSS